jgi:thiol-disulfide isomerase/thioredoxin
VIRRALMAALLMLCGPQAAHAQPPAVKIVFFTAGWCPNCQVLGPEITTAVGRVSGVEQVDIDATSTDRLRDSRVRAAAQGVTRLYDAYAGRTGFAAIVAADTGEPMVCITSAYAAPEIEAALRRAVARVRARAPLAEPGGSGCPAKRRQPY